MVISDSLKRKYPVFYCSNFEFGGEFRLSFEFLNKNFERYIVVSRKYITLINYGVIKVRLKRNKFIFYEYIQQIYELFYFAFFLPKKNIISGYINYCPLWNSLLWLLIDSEITIGPISGQPYRFNLSKLSFKHVIATIFLPFLNKLSIAIIKFRKLTTYSANFFIYEKLLANNIITVDFFSHLSKNSVVNINPSRRDFLFDIVIYEHPHPTKNVSQLFDVLFDLDFKLKIATFGFNVNHPLERVSHGYLNLTDLYFLLSSSKFFITMTDEVGGLIALDAVSCGCICVCKDGSGPSVYASNCIKFESESFKKNLINFLKNEYKHG